MSSSWKNPVTGYVEIDPVKFIRVFEAFKDDLSEMFSPSKGENKKLWGRINAWARDAKNIMDGTDKKKRKYLSVHKDNAEWLNDTLGELSKTQDELSNKHLGVSDLLYNRDTDVRLVPEGWDKSKTQWKRKSEIENLDNLIQQCKANLQQKQSQSGQSNQKPDASSSKQLTTSATDDSSPGFQYRKKWLEAFGTAMRSVVGLTDQLARPTHLLPFVRQLRNHRFDRYIWPAIQYRFGAPTMDRQADYLDDTHWTTVDTEDAVRQGLTNALANNQLVLMHDDAGMGKTAFSWMLFEHLLDVNASHPYVIRLEGIWPRSTDENKTPLPLMDVVLEELLGKRLMGRRIQSSDASSDSEEGFREALKRNNVFILLDGFDQMTKEDRAVALEEIEKTVNYLSEISNCHWLVSGRVFAFRDKNLSKTVRDQNVLRFRLKRFDLARQDEYFADLEKDPFFLQQEGEAKRLPLNYMCSTWRKEDDSNDLGIPLHLAEIRRVIEAYLSTNMAERNGKILGEIHSSSDLHARVSDVYLERALRHSPDASQNPAAYSKLPESSTQKRVLRHICGAIAMQMMLDGIFNASIDIKTSSLDSYRNVLAEDLVSTFLQRCKARYLQSLQDKPSYWDWGVEILQQIEVTHRGDIDVFQDECRSFRDTKTMEWYAASYWMNHCTDNEWQVGIPECGNGRIEQILGDKRWTRCWQLAMEMPTGYYNEVRLQTAIAKVLASPPTGERRYCQWMWIAWVNRLEQDQAALKKKLKPLRHNQDVIQEFRKPFQEQIAAQNPTALTLQYSAKRDAPDLELKNPNQTEKGWYRRIPDVGDFTKFKGERPEVVTVSPFWMRKFVVTVKEYHLFAPMHRLDLEFKKDDLPVTEIDWFCATMFCYWLGPGYHLPTEAQWEAACRANQLIDGELQNETEFWFGDKKEDAKKHAWITYNSQARPHTLEESKAEKEHENRFGLYDMSGNVWEWCSDWSGDYVKGANHDPVGPTEGSFRVIRGGGWSLGAAYCRSACRNGDAPKGCGNDLGFRLALSSSGIPQSPEAGK
jgi:formylglycine-generating enzyme required for sulfatase activity